VETPGDWNTGNTVGMALRSVALAGGIAAAAVLLGYLPGRLLGTSTAHTGTLLLCLLTPLLLPRYLLYYAWSLLLSPTSALGAALSARPDVARFAGAATSWMVMVTWYWPLAALLEGQGWRTMGTEALDVSRLDAGPVRRFASVTLPLLARPLCLAWAVCFAMSLAEFGTFHLAGVRTIGTELAMLYDRTRSAAAVARAAWPMAVPAAIIGIFLWRRTKDWATTPPLDRHRREGRAVQWTVTAALIGLSLIAPLALLIANARDPVAFRQFHTLHADELRWSLAISACAAAGALLMAVGTLSVGGAGWLGRLTSPVAHVTVFLAMFLPGSVIAAALLKAVGLVPMWRGLRQGWWMVSAGQAARFAGVAVILLGLARDRRSRRLSEMASTDGASQAAAWVHVHLPRVWPLILETFVLVTMLGMTELSATMVLLPAGVPNFAQRLLNQMHYAREQQVIASCLMLVGVYVALAGGVVLLLRTIKARAAVAPMLLAAALCLAGCQGDSKDPDDVKVLGAFGRTGMGEGEFLYPRAIARAADGSLFVVDKTGRIQRFGRQGGFDVLGVIRMPRTEAGKPTGLTVAPDGKLYVADTHYHRVLIFEPDGRAVGEFGKFGQADGCFIYPTDVAFGPDGRIFVSEYGGNDRVSVFTPKGEFLFSFGRPGSGRGELARPSALCVDAARSKLYVADACNHRIAVYNLDGRLERYFGSPGRGPGELRYPYDLALLGGADEPQLLVCEFGNNRLQLFSAEGESLGTRGRAGRELGRLAYPWGVAVDASRRAYVVDAGNNRVQVWQL